MLKIKVFPHRGRNIQVPRRKFCRSWNKNTKRRRKRRKEK